MAGRLILMEITSRMFILEVISIKIYNFYNLLKITMSSTRISMTS